MRDMVRLQDPEKLVKAMGIARHVEELQREPKNSEQTTQRCNGTRSRGTSTVAQSGSPVT